MSSHLTGLSKAFGNTSDPRYLFQSQTHANALSLLAAGTEESRNIRVLIGEPGMGKTILLLHLLGRFQHSALTAHLFWTQLGRGEFLHYFLHELGENSAGIRRVRAGSRIDAQSKRSAEIVREDAAAELFCPCPARQSTHVCCGFPPFRLLGDSERWRVSEIGTGSEDLTCCQMLYSSRSDAKT